LNNPNHLNQSLNKKTNVKQFKFFLIAFVLLLSGSLGFFVYGSEQFHHSFSNVISNIRNFSNYFNVVGAQTVKAKDSIAFQINTTLSTFEKDLKANNNNSNYYRLTNDALKELASVRSTLKDSYKSLEGLNQLDREKNAYMSLLSQIESIEQTRWTVMIGVVTVSMLLIMLLVIGLIRNSKGSLCFFAFSAVLSLISFWILIAFYLGITVFIADYCTSPDEFILTVAERNHMKNLVQYYTSCTSTPASSRSNLYQQPSRFTPFKLDLNKAESKLRTAATIYNDNLIRMAHPILGEDVLRSYNFQEAILNIESTLDTIRSLIRCDQTSQSYKSAVKILCFNSIFGLALVVLSSMAFGLILPILICIIPQMWRRMHTKEYYNYNSSSSNSNTDEAHPFIPSSSANGQIRTNISAARQFNESPSFQRMTINNNNNNSNSNYMGASTLGRNTTRTSSMRQAANNATSNYASPLNNYCNTQARMNRVNEYMMNNDPYMMLNSNGMPSAPPAHHVNNYMDTHNDSYLSKMNTNTLATSSINVPIVLYPNSSNYGTRTLSRK